MTSTRTSWPSVSPAPRPRWTRSSGWKSGANGSHCRPRRERNRASRHAQLEAGAARRRRRADRRDGHGRPGAARGRGRGVRAARRFGQGPGADRRSQGCRVGQSVGMILPGDALGIEMSAGEAVFSRRAGYRRVSRCRRSCSTIGCWRWTTSPSRIVPTCGVIAESPARWPPSAASSSSLTRWRRWRSLTQVEGSQRFHSADRGRLGRAAL